MKHIFGIFGRDMKNIATNWVALILIGGLVFLPSLYAWFNIKASWDPYGKTGGLTVAVANNDTGATIKEKRFNLGNEIVKSLKKNDKIGWKFIDKKTAKKGVRHGDYYAAIVIPEDFSKDIASVVTKNPTKARVDYYENDKINAISPKITSKGASSIIEEVNENFIREANGAIFSALNEAGYELVQNRPTIDQVRDLIYRLNALSPKLNEAVNLAIEDVDKSQELVDQAQEGLGTVDSIARDGERFAGKLKPFIDQSSQTVESMGPVVKQNLLLMQQAAATVSDLPEMLEKNDFKPEEVQPVLDQAVSRLTVANNVSGKMIEFFSGLDSLQGLEQPSPITASLQEIKGNLENELNLASQVSEAVKNGSVPAKELLDRLAAAAGEADRALGDLLGRYDSEILPAIKSGLDRVNGNIEKANGLFTTAKNMVPEVSKILGDAERGLTVGDEKLQEVQEQLPALEAKLKSLAGEIQKVENEGTLDEMIELLTLNAAKETEFFAEPVVMKSHQYYQIPNYGSAMSPFYTTLSLWVGTLLLVSMLTVEVHEPGREFKSYQVYFGRFLTFLTLAVLQSILVTTGDMFLLGTYVAEKPWFVLFGMLQSAVFMLIVYTLVSVFGNVGKAMAIVMLVIQIGGSGGTFPIQLTPEFFQEIHPFLPFTYGISMLREAMGGIIWDIAYRDIIALLAFGGLALILGLALKKFINRAALPLTKKAKDSRLLH
ncbi:YhgE/Pip domain-containing protein [Mesobacillus zeae]|uniref:YhgE/Pip domain-containing protein n=1 Tax=Mesobacillus zeae TaxID=1917180 RepID=A0A398BGZ3_9BACI|nr:YhgE/Pip domain-containing protein [Mesobacillus zeae]RID86753.1 YhgE/Pip domain-containing protein [Mesobacillus zeae]